MVVEDFAAEEPTVERQRLRTVTLSLGLGVAAASALLALGAAVTVPLIGSAREHLGSQSMASAAVSFMIGAALVTGGALRWKAERKPIALRWALAAAVAALALGAWTLWRADGLQLGSAASLLVDASGIVIVSSASVLAAVVAA